MFAAYKGNTGIVKLLLKYNADINYQDYFGNTALHYAAEKGHIKITELLIENNASLDDKSQWSKQTPLDLAIKNGHIHIIKLFLNKNVISIDYVLDEKEYSFIAVNNVHANLVKFLLEEGMDTNIKDRSGITLILDAISTRIAKLFQKGNANTKYDNTLKITKPN